MGDLRRQPLLVADARPDSRQQRIECRREPGQLVPRGPEIEPLIEVVIAPFGRLRRHVGNRPQRHADGSPGDQRAGDQDEHVEHDHPPDRDPLGVLVGDEPHPDDDRPHPAVATRRVGRSREQLRVADRPSTAPDDPIEPPRSRLGGRRRRRMLDRPRTVEDPRVLVEQRVVRRLPDPNPTARHLERRQDGRRPSPQHRDRVVVEPARQQQRHRQRENRETAGQREHRGDRHPATDPEPAHRRV